MLIAWFNGTLHHELHGREDAPRLGSCSWLQILVLVLSWVPSSPRQAAPAGVPSPPTPLCCSTVVALLWFLAARGDQPEYRRPSRQYVIGTALCAAVLAVSAFLPAGPRVLVWGLTGVAYLAGLAAVTAMASPLRADALTMTDALIERFGLLIIIVLGETVTGVVSGLAHTPVDALTLVVALIAVVAGFGAWWTYFDFAGARPPRRARPPTLVWMLTHLPLTAAVAGMGAAMVSLVHGAHATRTPTSTAWALGTGTAVVLASTAVLTTCLQAWGDQPGRSRPLLMICIAASIGCLGVGVARGRRRLASADLQNGALTGAPHLRSPT